METRFGPTIELLSNRFPRHEFTIWRLYLRDPAFRAVCDDYGEVQHALEHWQAAERAVPQRVAEYRHMLEELEAEVLTFLNPSGPRSAGAPSRMAPLPAHRNARNQEGNSE